MTEMMSLQFEIWIKEFVCIYSLTLLLTVDFLKIYLFKKLALQMNLLDYIFLKNKENKWL